MAVNNSPNHKLKSESGFMTRNLMLEKDREKKMELNETEKQNLKDRILGEMPKQISMGLQRRKVLLLRTQSLVLCSI